MYTLLDPDDPNSVERARQQVASVIEQQIESGLDMLLTLQPEDAPEVERQFREIVNATLTNWRDRLVP